MTISARKWLLPALLALMALLALAGAAAPFCPGLNAPFLQNWDDGRFIVNNRHLALTAKNFRRYGVKSYQQLYTPLPIYSLMVDKALFGLNPKAFRIHNLLLHLGCATLLFLILRQLRIPPPAAIAAALYWAVSAQRVESVLWIVERKDLLCGILAMGSVLAFLHALSTPQERPCRGWLWVLLAALTGALTLGCKPAAAPLAGVYVVLILLLKRWRQWWLWVPSGAIVAATIGAGILTANNNPGALQSNPLVLLHNLLWYPVTGLLPFFPTNTIYPQVTTWSQVWPWIPAAGVIASALLFLARRRGFSWWQIFAAAIILGGMLLPALGLWQYTQFHYCDRYNYLPAAVIIALAAMALFPRDSGETRAIALGTVLLLVGAVAAGILAWRTTPNWSNDRAIWHSALNRTGPINPKVFEVATGDALLREDPKDLLYIARRMEEQRLQLALPNRQVENSALILKAEALLLQDDFQNAAKLLQILWEEEQRSGQLHFMRGSNYRIIYEENLPLLRIIRRRQRN